MAPADCYLIWGGIVRISRDWVQERCVSIYQGLADPNRPCLMYSPARTSPAQGASAALRDRFLLKRWGREA